MFTVACCAAAGCGSSNAKEPHKALPRAKDATNPVIQRRAGAEVKRATERAALDQAGSAAEGNAEVGDSSVNCVPESAFKLSCVVTGTTQTAPGGDESLLMAIGPFRARWDVLV